MDDDKEALRVVEVTANSERKTGFEASNLRGRKLQRTLTAALLVAVIVIGSAAVYQQQQIATLSSTISDLQNTGVSLTQNIASLKAEEGIIVTCEDFEIRPQDVNISTLRVLVMPAGGTASICVRYTALHEVDGGSNALLPYAVVDLARVTSTCIPCGAVHSILVNSTGTHSVMVQPNVYSLTVLYTITAPENSTGFYGLFWSRDTCGALPLAVNTNAYAGHLQLNASDFANFPTVINCTPVTISAVSISMVRGVTAQYVKCGLPTCVPT